MAQCPGSCTTTTPSGAAWFKIAQAGLLSGTLTTGLWGQGQLVNDNSSWTTTIPANLAPGNYLLRHELIALHSSNQPQWYPECAQLVVTGSGTQTPSASYKASIPGVYSMSDPEVNIDIYTNDNAQRTVSLIYHCPSKLVPFDLFALVGPFSNNPHQRNEKEEEIIAS